MYASIGNRSSLTTRVVKACIPHTSLMGEGGVILRGQNFVCSKLIMFLILLTTYSPARNAPELECNVEDR